jgi:alpha-beta hydrolase superfamily lysophospholipase
MLAVASVLSAVMPKVPAVAVDANLVSRDPAVVADYQSDPLNHHGKLPLRTVAELAAAVKSWPESVGAITIPTLLIYGTADGLCPPRGSEMLRQKLGSSDLTVIPYDGLYHEIFNEPEREQVLADTVAWLDHHVAAVVEHK